MRQKNATKMIKSRFEEHENCTSFLTLVLIHPNQIVEPKDEKIWKKKREKTQNCTSK